MRPDDPLDGAPSVAAGTVWEELEGGEPKADARYAWGGELGRGGMGVVRSATDVWLDRDVAVKRPRADLPPTVRDRVMREARITARLVHPGIVPVSDVGEDDLGPFYTMPVLTGRSLQERLEDGLAPGVWVRIVAEAARALAHAHAHGIVHRDIKPANLIVGDGGEVWVVDWGVAWDRANPTEDRVGTPGFAAPEQSEGRISPACDVFGLGRVLQTALPDAPAELRAVIHRCTEPRPEDRYRDGAALAEELDRWLAGLRVTAHDYRLSELVRRWVRAHRALVAVLALSCVTVGGIGARAYESNRQERLRADRALSQSLARGAEARAAAGRRPEAEVLAVHALRAANNPVARGVLWPWLDAERPRTLHEWSPDCDGPVLLEDGAVACVDVHRVRIFEPDGSPRTTFSVEHGASAPLVANWTGDSLVVLTAERALWSLAPGASRVLGEDYDFPGFVTGDVVATHDGRRVHWEEAGAMYRTEPLCGVRIEAARTVDGQLWVACRDGTARLGTLSEPGEPIDVPGYGSAWASGPRPVLGTFEGEILEWHGEWRARASGVGPVRRLSALHSGALLAHGEAGDARVHWPDGRTAVLPGRYQQVAGRDAVVSVSTSVTVRDVPRPPHQQLDRRVAGGVSTMAISPTGAFVVVGSATGEVVHWIPATGVMRTLRAQGERSAKGLAVLSDDAIVYEHVGQVHIDRGEHSEPVQDVLVHLAAASEQTYAFTPYAPVLRLLTDGVLTEVPLDERASALLAAPHGFWVGLEDGLVLAIDRDGREVERRELGPIQALAVVGDDLVRAAGPIVAWHAGEGVRWEVELDGAVTALAASETAVAVGLQDGTLVLLSADGTLIAETRAHERLVSVLTFGDGALFSAGWDGLVRRWPMVPWGALPTVEAAEAAWGLDLDASLDL